MKQNFKKLVNVYKNFAEQKVQAQNFLKANIETAHKNHTGDYLQTYVKLLTDNFDKRFKSEFAALGNEFNKALDYEQDLILAATQAQRPDDYDIKLSNALKMLEALDAKFISENKAAIKDAVQPFSNDFMAKAAISAILTNKSVSPFGLFDEQATHLLEKIEVARNFTNDKAYDNVYIATDMERFFDMYFPEPNQTDVAANESFHFNFLPANSNKESFWGQ